MPQAYVWKTKKNETKDQTANSKKCLERKAHHMPNYNRMWWEAVVLKICHEFVKEF
jgi:hypothetical protein